MTAFYSNSIGTGRITLPSTFTVNEADPLSFTLTANTSLTLPDSGTLVTGGAPTTYSAVIRDSAGNNFTGISGSFYYITVNGLTYVTVDINWTGIGSAVTSNDIQVTLPSAVTQKAAFSLYWMGAVVLDDVGPMKAIWCGADSGNSYATFPISVGDGTMTHLKVGDIASPGEIIFSGIYY